MIKKLWSLETTEMNSNQIVCKAEPKHGKFRVYVEYRRNENGNSYRQFEAYTTTYSFKTLGAAVKKAEKLKRIYSN